MAEKKTGGSLAKVLIVAVAAAAVGAFFVFDLGQFLTLTYLKEQQHAMNAYINDHFLASLSAFLVIYVLTAALSLPGAAILTLAGGALFGVAWGTVAVSFASTIGATLAFLVSRFLLRDAIQQRFADKLRAINDGIEKDGAFYLFTLRLVPIFPFFIINLVMGLTPIKVWHFFVISQVGMLPGTLVYVNAGTEIAKIDSMAGILSPSLLASFALLGIFPILAKKGLAWLASYRKQNS